MSTTSRSAFFAAATLLLGASALGAQSGGEKPRIAGIAPAPKSASESDGSPRRGHHAPHYQGAVPVFVANNGQIYADFGYGYEPVIRNCAYAGGVAYSAPVQSPTYSAPTYTPPAYTPPSYNPPTYTPPSYGQTTFGAKNTQPAPAQATQSERDLAAANAAPAAPQPQPQRAAAAACWRADEQGRVIVVRP